MTTINLSWTSSLVQERMMRCRLETLHIPNPTDDEIYRAAVKNLQHKQSKAGIVTDIDVLFKPQLEMGNKILYLMANNKQGILEVIAYTTIDDIKRDFSGGQTGMGVIPKMIRKK